MIASCSLAFSAYWHPASGGQHGLLSVSEFLSCNRDVFCVSRGPCWSDLQYRLQVSHGTPAYTKCMSSSRTPACLHISGIRSCAGSDSRLAVSVVTAATDLDCARLSALYACSGLMFLSNNDSGYQLFSL